jgi:hypothetical protein
MGLEGRTFAKIAWLLRGIQLGRLAMLQSIRQGALARVATENKAEPDAAIEAHRPAELSIAGIPKCRERSFLKSASEDA